MDKMLSRMITPTSQMVGYLILKILMARNIYDGVKRVKVVIASVAAFASMRAIARYDYWALIISDSIPAIPIETKAVLFGIGHLRMRQEEGISVCIGRSDDIIVLVMDKNIDLKKKKKVLTGFFSLYESLPEHHFFKNPYFCCIIHILLTLYFANNLGFKFALRLLLRLLEDGKISLETYREIVSQLLIGGVSTVDIEVV